ncbi:serine/threonine protein kinase [Rhodococcus fascians]|nr:serine/threonine protein kinase [Rhodococcus fascians]MBY4419101.1 serine/threonine protein kinase [Rhodococcus fascians]
MTPFNRVRELGHGFFGRVYLEYDVGLGRYCAAKYLENTGLLISDHAEAQAMLLGKSDNVVEVYSTDSDEGTPVIRMEYLANGSVADRYGQNPAPVLEALRIMEAACRGVEHIHAMKLLHRDIKPANILLDDQHIAKVSDFGLACKAGDVEDTPIPYAAHLPPESRETGYIENTLGDVYGLGITAYRLLNGDRRVRGKLDGNATDIPALDDWLPYIHNPLRLAITKALHTDLRKRTKSADVFRHALERARPTVSWVANADGLHSWTGSALDGTNWKAAIKPDKGKTKRAFTIYRQLPGKEFRASQRADFKNFSSSAMALDHAATVLQRVAAQGR